MTVRIYFAILFKANFIYLVKTASHYASPLRSFLELSPPVPFASRFLNTRTMKETFKSFVELLISIALDEDLVTALERANGEQIDFLVPDWFDNPILKIKR